MPRELVYGVIFIATVLAAIIYFAAPRSAFGSPHLLGQQLLLAAEERNWSRAKVLLDSGADPEVTELDPSQLVHRRSWLEILGLQGGIRMGGFRPSLIRPTALHQAIQQGNVSAVQLLLDHHAKLMPDDLNACRYCGRRDVINLVEDAGHVPADRRSLAQAPLAAGAATASPRVFPATIGAIAMRHLLWLSDHEVLLVRINPARFSALDLRTGTESDLPDLTRQWSDQGQFDPDMLALSPDTQWVVGFGGTVDHPTWRATRIHGDGLQEWDRTSNPKSSYAVERGPLIAWRDGTRWVEINHVGPGGDCVVRTRTLGQPDVQELPLDRSGYEYMTDYPSTLFTFPDPDRGFLRGQASRGNFHGSNFFVGFMADITAGPDAWHMVKREVHVDASNQPGWFERCVPSPDGKRLAWLDHFSASEASDILLGDANGGNLRIVCEKLFAVQNGKAGRSEAPWPRQLEWTPSGDGLIFWRGMNGTNGLVFLPLAPEE